MPPKLPPRKPRNPKLKNRNKGKKRAVPQVSPLLLVSVCLVGSFVAALGGVFVMNKFQAKPSANLVTASNDDASLEAIAENSPDEKSGDVLSKDQEGSNSRDTDKGKQPFTNTSENNDKEVEESPVPEDALPMEPEDEKVAEINQDSKPIDVPLQVEQPTLDGPVTRVSEEVPVVAPLIPKVLTKIGKNAFATTRKNFRYQTSAKNAYILYEAFSKSYEFDKYQQGRVDEELNEWKERADKNLYRLGTEWVEKAVVDKAIDEANRLVEAGIQSLEERNYNTAVEIFDQASRANPNGIRADYLVGLMYSLDFSGARNPEKAEQHFNRVLSRDPPHGAALNSLGIAQLKQHDYHDAYQSFRTASEVIPKCPEVIHNLGRLLSLAKRDRLSPAEPLLEKFEELYANLIASEKFEQTEEGTGWLHMPPVFPQTERKETLIPVEDAANPTAESFVKHSSGSGFLVHPNYYLTNRHVASDEDRGVADKIGVQISHPGQPVIEKFGDVVAISDEVDLALLHVPGAEGVSLKLLESNVPLASEVLILGYPITHKFGDQLKATQGIVSGLPDLNRRLGAPFYFFDALADHGNSGGPILDRQGRVASILTVGISDIDINAKFTGGVPSIEAIQFVREHLKEIPSPELDVPAKQEWSDLVARYSPSVVKVNVYYLSGVPQAARQVAANARTQNYLEDKTCATCSGKTILHCHAKGCVNGKITETTFRTGVVGIGNARKVARVPVYNTVDCKNCVNGEFDCPFCQDGYDHELK